MSTENVLNLIMSFLYTFLPLLLFLSTTHFTSSILDNSSLPGCLNKCGKVEISYPFGIEDGCFLPGFKIVCNDGVPFLSESNIQLLQILEESVRVNSTPFIATYCPSSTSKNGGEIISIKFSEDSPYSVSASSNNFMVVGCNASGTISDNDTISSQCLSQCFVGDKIVDGSCAGRGCCKTSVPLFKKKLYLYIEKEFSGLILSSRPCSYGFLAEHGSFTLSESELQDFNTTANISMRLDWAIGEIGCDEAKKNGFYVCGEGSVCVESERGSGYLCQCPAGFTGCPYLNGSRGCKDIDECKDPSTCAPQATCVNKVPGFKCVCPSGSSGDGLNLVHGTGCSKTFPVMKLALGLGVSFLFLLLISSWLSWALRRKRIRELREKFFLQNGGMLLRSQMASSDGGTIETTRIFTAEELEKATNNYDNSRILGKGGHGTVYKGTLQDNRVVAIKKSKIVDKSQIQQFINEVIVLAQINHRNVVKLLGCCLETEVPLLVYEYVSNGTLYHHIHQTNPGIRISWEDRVRIATETADALAYLHSSASIPIIHRDVKSANILLDENYMTKVSDFGSSKLVPLDQTQITTLVQGTLGYLDPEYFQTSQLTAKSDVYSFGVVLIELLTGQKPLSFERSQEGTNLAMYFLSSIKTSTLMEILDVQILSEETNDQVQAVAKLALKCLCLMGKERPTMKEVAQELTFLRGFKKHSHEKVMCTSDEHQSSPGVWLGESNSPSEVFPFGWGR